MASLRKVIGDTCCLQVNVHVFFCKASAAHTAGTDWCCCAPATMLAHIMDNTQKHVAGDRRGGG